MTKRMACGLRLHRPYETVYMGIQNAEDVSSNSTKAAIIFGFSVTTCDKKNHSM